jgi:hypothetical protein
MKRVKWVAGGVLILAAVAGCGTSEGQQHKAMTSFAPSSALEHCIGIAKGQTRSGKIGPAPERMQYCEQIPGWDLYEQAGQHFQSGDHAGAAKVVTSSAEAGNPIAQLRLAMLYEAGDGVPRDKKMAFNWYLRAAEAGEPGAQSEVGGYYEDADGVPENWTAAAEWYRRSAEAGWYKGELALARAYQFGIGVPQSRQQAIYWYRKVGNEDNGKGAYGANWLSSPSNNIGFRNDEEHNLVIGGKLRFALSSNDPAGITFYNSQQRIAWLQGLRNKIDFDETTTMWNIAASEYQSCRSTGGDNCHAPGAKPR